MVRESTIKGGSNFILSQEGGPASRLRGASQGGTPKQERKDSLLAGNVKGGGLMTSIKYQRNDKNSSPTTEKP